MNVKFIIGEAGTAKTTNLMKIAVQLYKQKKRFVCLAFTHSAVNNMKEKFLDCGDIVVKKEITNSENTIINSDDKKEKTKNQTTNQTKPQTTTKTKKYFKTIHSFLNIIPTEDGYFITRNFEFLKDYEYILIDEFTLIDNDTLDILFQNLTNIFSKSSKEISVILAGDILQLNPVNTHPVITYELFKNLKYETDIATAILVGKHLSNNIYAHPIYNTNNKMLLQKNFRYGSNVLNILNDALDNKFSKIYYYKDKEVYDFIKKGYIVLSSKYINLEKIYHQHIELKTPTILSRIGEINVNDKLLLTKNINQNFTNGDIIKINDITNDAITISLHCNPDNKTIIKKSDCKTDNTNETSESTSFPLLPLNFYSIFKAQGKSFDKIIVVLDDMFEITMLYTAITRARENVEFVRIHNLDNIMEDLAFKNKAFKLLKQIIYN